MALGGMAVAKGRAPAVTKFQKLQSGFYVLGTGSLKLNLGSDTTATNSLTAVVQGASVTFPVVDADLDIPPTSTLPVTVHVSKDVALDDKQPAHVDATITVVYKGTLPDVYGMKASWVITDPAGNRIGNQVDAPLRTGIWKP